MQTPGRKITEKHIYRILRHDWKVPVRKAEASRTVLADLGLSEIEVNWLLTFIEWRYSITINADSVPLQTTVEEFVQQVIAAPKAAA